ncbi:amidohydrolase [Aquicoccus sp. SCR17]|nr:amidohydrolase [Carideicomes alvinocaridis]
MPIINRIAEFHDEMQGWRRHLHAHPELLFDCHDTSRFVAERLREFGVDELHEGIATTGLVAIIEGRGGAGPTIGLRADMDALPIEEATGAAHASTVPGKMHACGHDGHTTMLLGAAKYLAETRNFAGRVALIFQPAEEGGRGGEVMVQEGIMDRFGITQVYGIHNGPNLPLGHVMTRPGPLLAAFDGFEIKVTGRGGHAAMPHDTLDPLPCAVAIYQGIQTISSRNLHAMQNAVISVTQIHGGTAFNVVPDAASLGGTVRTLQREGRDMILRRIDEIVEATAAAYGCRAEIEWAEGAPATSNDPEKTVFAAEVAREVVGEAQVNDDAPPLMGSEDFSFMLEARPGNYIFLGAGPGADLHNPGFDFNDEIAPIGASYFVRLVERAQPARAGLAAE